MSKAEKLARPYTQQDQDLASCAKLHRWVEPRLYPEIGAGGYSRFDHRMAYVVRVNSLIQSGMTLRLPEPDRVEADSLLPLCMMKIRRTLKRLFPPAIFSDYSYTYNGQPFYHAERVALARFWQFTMSLTPLPLRSFLYIFMFKKSLSPVSPFAGT